MAAIMTMCPVLMGDYKNRVFHLIATALAIVGFGDAEAIAQGYALKVAASKMTVADGLEANLFAGEPEVRQPILVKVDDRGRLWTIQYLQYPNPSGLKRVKVDRHSRTIYDRIPEPPPRGPKGTDLITILEDTDGDGRADQVKDFVGGLNLTTGVAFGHGGVFVIQVPYLLFYPDRNGDDVPDGDPEVLLKGFGMEDAQSFANHLTWGPDGWLYGLNGSTTTCNIRGIEFQQGCWRYHPITKEFELFCEGGGNLYGLTFDADGNLFYSGNDGLFVHAVQGAYYRKSFGKHGPLHNHYAYGYFDPVIKGEVPGGPPTGGTIYLGHSFPERFHGKYIAGNFLRHSSWWWHVSPSGTTFEVNYGGELLDARDTWFSPTDMCMGPDGAMYVSDFHDERNSHPDPDAQWDRSNGRIYRIQAPGARPVTGLDLAKLSSDELVDLLSHPNSWYADRARNLLAYRRDASVAARLETMALQRDDSRLALQGVWALHVTRGLSDVVAVKLFSHPYEYVRSWAVRLVGDNRRVSPDVRRGLIALAKSDPSPVVRCQLAATAKRLPANDGLAIVERLLDRDIDGADARMPWLLWWAIEDKAISDTDQLLGYFARGEAWDSQLNRFNIPKLLRRLAAEGRTENYRDCSRLLAATPPEHLRSMIAALNLGLAERATVLGGIGPGGLYSEFGSSDAFKQKNKSRQYEPVTSELRDTIVEFWKVSRSDPLRMKVAIRAGVRAAYDHLVATLSNPRVDAGARVVLLGLLVSFGEKDCVPVVLGSIEPGEPEAVQAAAIDVLQRFESTEITERLLAVYPEMSPTLRSVTRTALLSRPTSARVFLNLVDAKELDAQEIPIDQLRRIALHEDEELDRLVSKHWGKIQAATPEEKLATMRRYDNDLKTSGDAGRGKELFTKHCASCHRLFGEGNQVGPDLTDTNLTDRTVLLRNIVDPSAIIRREYMNYILATSSGRVLTGLIAEQNAASLTLLDAENKRTTIPRGEIAELRESLVSLMPENLLDTLAPQEIRDLFSYLQSQGSKSPSVDLGR